MIKMIVKDILFLGQKSELATRDDINFKLKIKTYKDFTAQIIQHEVDHCNGIII